MPSQPAIFDKQDQNPKWQPNVHKFGGSSLRSANQITRVAHFIKEQTDIGDIIVVSANGQVTDWLEYVKQGQSQYVEKINNYLLKLSQDLTLPLQEKFKASLSNDLKTIEKILADKANYHRVIAFGEDWSTRLLKAYCDNLNINVIDLAAQNVLKITDDEEGDTFDAKFAQNSLNNVYNSISNHRIILPGFIAENKDGETITLGRNGSDYSATVISSLINAKSITIWTDVDGIYSADPNIIDDAQKVANLSYCEAQALSELGANVLHQKTITPLLGTNTIAYVKNSLIDQSQGTEINRNANDEKQVKTITIKKSLKNILIENISEISAKRIEKHFLEKHIATYANTYDKSKQCLSFYVESKDCFDTNILIKNNDAEAKVSDKNLSLISLVGQNIRQNKDVISKFLSRIDAFDIEHIHYPSNSHTLCTLIADKQAERLLKDLHDTFFIIEPSLPIVVLGFGNIGKQFIDILKRKKNIIESSIDRALSIKAIANSRFYNYSKSCLTLEDDVCLDNKFDNSNNQLLEKLNQYKDKELIIIDLTASEKVASQYLNFAQNQWHIISANKIAPANAEYAKSIEAEIAKNNRQWLTNTTVGAGLPIQSILQKINESGDQVEEISGIFSGSLSWLFSQYDGTKPFSSLVKIAQENALTEPDPREDLSGNDVIRKSRILARESGFDQAKEEFTPAIDEKYFGDSLNDFWDNSKVIDEQFDKLYQQAKSQNGVLRYVATLNQKSLTLSLKILAQNHPFANLNPCDNVFLIKTHWYNDNPLIIQGPGAGREVTAAGVVNDLCDLLRSC